MCSVDQRQQRRGDLAQRDEHGVQRVDRVLVARPEPIAAAADVPVRERVEELRPPSAQAPNRSYSSIVAVTSSTSARSSASR